MALVAVDGFALSFTTTSSFENVSWRAVSALLVAGVAPIAALDVARQIPSWRV
jgi:hypothetical protein